MKDPDNLVVMMMERGRTSDDGRGVQGVVTAMVVAMW